MAGLNTPSVQPTADQYNLIMKMVPLNCQLVWSGNEDAHKFISGLEGVLECSPILHSHWITFMYVMVPGSFELERQWIRDNIMTPLLSWNAAKAAFTAQFQRGDHIDMLRHLYNSCRQVGSESIQQYSLRFQTLATKLGYGDNDIQAIYNYINGLHERIQGKLQSHKSQMRTIPINGALAPKWDFTSLGATISLAIQIGTEPIPQQTPSSNTSPPLHLLNSALANPVYEQAPSSTKHEVGTESKKRKVETMEQQSSAPAAVSKATAETKCYRCQQYAHFAYECPTKIKRARRARVRTTALSTDTHTSTTNTIHQ